MIRQKLATRPLGKAIYGTLGVGRGWGLTEGFLKESGLPGWGAVEDRVFQTGKAQYIQRKKSSVSEWYMCEQQQASF